MPGLSGRHLRAAGAVGLIAAILGMALPAAGHDGPRAKHVLLLSIDPALHGYSDERAVALLRLRAEYSSSADRASRYMPFARYTSPSTTYEMAKFGSISSVYWACSIAWSNFRTR